MLAVSFLNKERLTNEVIFFTLERPQFSAEVSTINRREKRFGGNPSGDSQSQLMPGDE